LRRQGFGLLCVTEQEALNHLSYHKYVFLKDDGTPVSRDYYTENVNTSHRDHNNVDVPIHSPFGQLADTVVSRSVEEATQVLELADDYDHRFANEFPAAPIVSGFSLSHACKKLGTPMTQDDVAALLHSAADEHLDSPYETGNDPEVKVEQPLVTHSPTPTAPVLETTADPTPVFENQQNNLLQPKEQAALLWMLEKHPYTAEQLFEMQGALLLDELPEQVFIFALLDANKDSEFYDWLLDVMRKRSSRLSKMADAFSSYDPATPSQAPFVEEIIGDGGAGAKQRLTRRSSVNDPIRFPRQTKGRRRRP
jgi:uncharacterized protein YegL